MFSFKGQGNLGKLDKLVHLLVRKEFRKTPIVSSVDCPTGKFSMLLHIILQPHAKHYPRLTSYFHRNHIE